MPNLGGPAKGFDAFDFAEDHLGDSSNKFEDAEKHLKEFELEEKQGYSLNAPGNRSFKVQIDGVNAGADEIESEIEEEI